MNDTTTSTVGIDAVGGAAQALLEAFSTGSVWLIITAVLALLAVLVRFGPIAAWLRRSPAGWLPPLVMLLAAGFSAGVAAGAVEGWAAGVAAALTTAIGSGLIQKIIKEATD